MLHYWHQRPSEGPDFSRKPFAPGFSILPQRPEEAAGGDRSTRASMDFVMGVLVYRATASCKAYAVVMHRLCPVSREIQSACGIHLNRTVPCAVELGAVGKRQTIFHCAACLVSYSRSSSSRCAAFPTRENVHWEGDP